MRDPMKIKVKSSSKRSFSVRNDYRRRRTIQVDRRRRSNTIQNARRRRIFIG